MLVALNISDLARKGGIDVDKDSPLANSAVRSSRPSGCGLGATRVARSLDAPRPRRLEAAALPRMQTSSAITPRCDVSSQLPDAKRERARR